MNKRMIVKFCEGEKMAHVNIAADRLVERENVIFAYHGEMLTGVFDLGLIEAAYLSERVKASDER